MRRALRLAARGQGYVEPNPMVGCVIVNDGRVVGEGWHKEFGGPHAEIVALQQAKKTDLPGATAYVTLEPCCHQGKTPPCTKALVVAGVKRVVAAMEDPFPSVSGGGFDELRKAGVTCEVGLSEDEARELNAPYLRRLANGRPWIIAKWAQTSDHKLAMADGTRWISNERSREIVQQLRGRMDAIMVGSGTVRADDPMLTARPLDRKDVKRTATRIVVDSKCTIPLDSQLVRTARDVPVLVAVTEEAQSNKVKQLVNSGVEVFFTSGETHSDRLRFLLEELGRRKITNMMVEGGCRLLHNLFDIYAVDEVHVFTAPKEAGGDTPPAPNLRKQPLKDEIKENLDGDEYLQARLD